MFNLKRFFFAVLILNMGLLWSATCVFAQNVWPISGTTMPDQGLSSPYGPRLKASENFRYDFHQGIDIPTPVGTPIHAIADGEVRIAGNHQSYSDPLVQLKHQGGAFYSNYMHVSSWSVTVGQQVKKGDVIGLSGTGDSGFPHLHFEMRSGSLWRKDSVNPFRFLPYFNTATHTVQIANVNMNNPASPVISIMVSSSRQELDINIVEIAVFDAGNNMLLSQGICNLEQTNLKYNGDPKLLDNPDLDGVKISPAKFNGTSPMYQIEFQFHNLVGAPHIRVEAKALDIWGAASVAVFSN